MLLRELYSAQVSAAQLPWTPLRRRLLLYDRHHTTWAPSSAPRCQLLLVAFPNNNNSSPNPTAHVAEGAVQRAGFCGTAPMDAPQGASSAVRPAPHHVGAEFSASLPAVAGGISSSNNNNSSPNPTAHVAEGAVQRAGFCGTAPMDAPQGATSAVRPAPHHVGAEFSASLPAVAGGISSFNTNVSNIPAPTPIGAEGADSRAGFCGSASTGASHGASPAVRASSQPLGAEFCAQLPALADWGSALALPPLAPPLSALPPSALLRLAPGLCLSWLRLHRLCVSWLCVCWLCLC